MSFWRLLLSSCVCCVLAACHPLQAPNPPLLKQTNQLQLQLVWQKSVGDITIDSRPVVFANEVVLINSNGQLYGLNAITGKSILIQPLSMLPTTKLVYSKGRVLYVNSDGNLVAKAMMPFELSWQFPLANVSYALPVVSGNYVYAKTQAGDVYALNLSNGHLIWNHQNNMDFLGETQDPKPIVSGHVLIVMSQNGLLQAFDRFSGKLLWQKMLSPTVVSPIIFNHHIIIATKEEGMYAFTLKGKELWQLSLKIKHEMAATPSTLLVTKKDKLIAIAPDGTTLWVQSLSGFRLSPPAIMGEWVVVADQYGQVLVFSVSDGRYLAKIKASPDPIMIQPVVFMDRIYVLDQAAALSSIKVSW